MFAESLLESSPHSAHRSAWTKVASAILQSAAIAIALAMSLLHIERMQVTPPPLSIRMTPIDQPVSVHASASGNSMSTAQLRIQEFVQPNQIPSTIPRPTDRAPEPSGPPAVACIGNCEANGIISNIVGTGANIFPPSRPPARTAPPRVSEMQLGGVVKKVIPVYPEYAKRAGVQGTVVLSALVGKDGTVEKVDAVSGPPMLVRPAMDAVRQWRYRPYILNHEPTSVQTSITVRFMLGSAQ